MTSARARTGTRTVLLPAPCLTPRSLDPSAPASRRLVSIDSEVNRHQFLFVPQLR